MELTRVAQGLPDPVAARHVADRQKVSFDASLDHAAPASSTALSHEIDAAWRRGNELRAQGRELHFKADEHSGRVVIEVRDPTGQVLRRIPSSEALAILGGKQP